VSGPPPERVRVTGPARRRTAGAKPSAAREIDEDTRLGAIYVRSLLRDQLRLALRLLLILAVSVASMPVLFHLVPGLADVAIAGVPLSWLLLGVLVYPWLITLGWLYVRAAEAHERDFAELVRGDE
jgi:hypothetical protein